MGKTINLYFTTTRDSIFYEKFGMKLVKNEEYEKDVELKEGKANMTLPYKDRVFYNPVQEYNRDLSICVLNVFFSLYGQSLISKRKASKEIYESNMKKSTHIDHKEEHNEIKESGKRIIIKEVHPLPFLSERSLTEFVVLEALAATGLRGIRYALEVKDASFIITNDLQNYALQTIIINSENNLVNEKIVATQMDAANLLYSIRTPACDRVEVIDIDPYGSASPFLDGAVQAISEGGLLCITCTDLATLCGNNSTSCASKYNCIPLKTKFCHELALRIVLNSIETHANRYKRYIKPLICFSIDFYVRIFVRVFTGSQNVEKSFNNRSFVLYCGFCHSFDFHKMFSEGEGKLVANKPPDEAKYTCKVCKCKMKLGGPVWTDQIYEKKFLDECIKYVKDPSCDLNTKRRILGMTTVLSEELPNSPFYYHLPSLFSIAKCKVAPILEIQSDLHKMGYKTSRSHAKKDSLKTDAPSEVLSWKKNQQIKAEDDSQQQREIVGPIKNILERTIKYKHDFKVSSELIPVSEKDNLLRYQINPSSNWGPGKRCYSDICLRTI